MPAMPTAPKTRVMIVDDQRLARHYFDLVLAASNRYEVAFQVESATFADTYVLRGDVDLVLMDVLMTDGSSSFDAVAHIKHLRPHVKVVMVTSIPETSWMDRARQLGVDGFWYKEAETETILAVMDRVMAGERVFPDAVPLVRIGMTDSSRLTAREVEILRALADGLSNDEIADALHLSLSTVKTHLRHLLEKTGCENRTQLALQGRLSGIVVGASEL